MDVEIADNLILQELRLLRLDLKEEVQRICNEIRLLNSAILSKTVHSTNQEANNKHENTVQFKTKHCLEVQQYQKNHENSVDTAQVCKPFPTLHNVKTEDCSNENNPFLIKHDHVQQSNLSSSCFFENEKKVVVEEVNEDMHDGNKVYQTQTDKDEYEHQITLINSADNDMNSFYESKSCNEINVDLDLTNIHSSNYTNSNSINILSYSWQGETVEDHDGNKADGLTSLINNSQNCEDSVIQNNCNETLTEIKCTVCSQLFQVYSNYLVHLKAHSDSEQYSYNMSSTSTISTQTRSVGTTGTKRRYSCDYCSKAFHFRSNLKLHMYIHTGERPYACSICNKKFTQKSNMLSHTRIHSGKKPHSCSICSKSFHKQADLNRHTRIHTGEKPYVCSVCSKSFTQKSNLTSHVRIHSVEKTLTCITCNKSFNKQADLFGHTCSHT